MTKLLTSICLLCVAAVLVFGGLMFFEPTTRAAVLNQLNENLTTNGIDGQNGKSAYELAVENGFEGTVEEWIASLQGTNGIDGKDGENGIDGQNGINGVDGINGTDGVNGLDGKDGENGADGQNGTDGIDGKDGENGVDGTNGIDGQDGKDGIDGINGNDGENGVDGANGTDGQDGKDGENGTDGQDGLIYFYVPDYKNAVLIEDVYSTNINVQAEDNGYVNIVFSGKTNVSVQVATGIITVFRGNTGSDSLTSCFIPIAEGDTIQIFASADVTIQVYFVPLVAVAF